MEELKKKRIKKRITAPDPETETFFLRLHSHVNTDGISERQLIFRRRWK